MNALPFPVRPVARRSVLKLGGAALVAPGMVSRSFAAGPPPSWLAPPLSNPQTVELETDLTSQKDIALDTGTDYIIRIGTRSGGVVTRRNVRLVGGRNIVLIGGHIKRAPDTPASDGADFSRTHFPGSLLQLGGHSGVAYVEGLLLDVGDNYGVDAINVGSRPPAAPGNFVFRYVHVRGVTGTAKGSHADGFQIVNAVNQVLCGHMTIISAYQGMNIQPEFPIGYCWLDQCNIRYGNPDFHSGGANGYAFWLDGPADKFHQPAQYRLDNVYVEERTGFTPWEEGSIAPMRKAADGNRPVAGHPDSAQFPSQNCQGFVTKGLPPGGDFCPPGKIVDAAGAVIYQRNPRDEP